MANVAIAGGRGNVGQTIAEVLKNDSAHQGFILSREKVQDEAVGLPVIAADYTSVESLRETLEKHQIHTVISALQMDGPCMRSQFNLIKAASASSVTKRFIPSSYFVYPLREHVKLWPELQGYFDCLDELENTDLEWSVVSNGFFLDYFVPQLKSHLRPHSAFIDMENKAASVPGNGDNRVTITYSFDVARAVVGALGLDNWPRHMNIRGETLTLNDFVRIAEEARGSKFNVSYDSAEKLGRMEVTELPAHANLNDKAKEGALAINALSGLWVTMGIFEIPEDDFLERLGTKPLNVRSTINRFWANQKF